MPATAIQKNIRDIASKIIGHRPNYSDRKKNGRKITWETGQFQKVTTADLERNFRAVTDAIQAAYPAVKVDILFTPSNASLGHRTSRLSITISDEK